MCALSGGLADQLGGAVEIGGGIEGLRGDWSMAFLMVIVNGTDQPRVLVVSRQSCRREAFLRWASSIGYQASSTKHRACAGQIVSWCSLRPVIVIAKDMSIR